MRGCRGDKEETNTYVKQTILENKISEAYYKPISQSHCFIAAGFPISRSKINKLRIFKLRNSFLLSSLLISN